MITATAVLANPPAECIGKPTAWKKNVLYALNEAGIKGATMSDIRQTVFDNHDPEFDVYVGNETVHVTCDDSGDADCECSVESQ
jgi:hypothetical protein